MKMIMIQILFVASNNINFDIKNLLFVGFVTDTLQACSGSSPVSERPRTTVSVEALHPGLQC